MKYELIKLIRNKFFIFSFLIIIIISILIPIYTFNNYEVYDFDQKIDLSGKDAINYEKYKDNNPRLVDSKFISEFYNNLNNINTDSTDRKMVLINDMYPSFTTTILKLYESFDEFESTKGRDFYERNFKYIEEKNHNQNNILKISKKLTEIKSPYRYVYCNYWNQIYNCTGIIFLIISLVLLFQFSKLYTDENKYNIDKIMSTFKRSKLDLIFKHKIFSFLLIAIIEMVVSVGLFSSIYKYYTNFSGSSASIQIIYPNSLINMNFGNYYIYTIVIFCVSLIAILLLEHFFSLLTKSSSVSFALSLLLIILFYFNSNFNTIFLIANPYCAINVEKNIQSMYVNKFGFLTSDIIITFSFFTILIISFIVYKLFLRFIRRN